MFSKPSRRLSQRQRLWLLVGTLSSFLLVFLWMASSPPKHEPHRVHALEAELVYLPLIAADVPILTSTPTNTPTSTPTNTPTSTPTNTSTSTPTNTSTSTPTNTLVPQLVQNGDFEQGDNGDWTLSITPTASLTLISNQLPEGIQPHAGTWAAWLGGADNVTTEISQTITLPDRPMRLVYYYWIDSSEVFCGGFDISMLHINGTSIDIMVLCTEKNTGGWVQDEQDMSAYAGQTVTISFNVINDTVSSSNLYLDDISLEEAP